MAERGGNNNDIQFQIAALTQHLEKLIKKRGDDFHSSLDLFERNMTARRSYTQFNSNNWRDRNKREDVVFSSNSEHFIHEKSTQKPQEQSTNRIKGSEAHDLHWKKLSEEVQMQEKYKERRENEEEKQKESDLSREKETRDKGKSERCEKEKDHNSNITFLSFNVSNLQVQEKESPCLEKQINITPSGPLYIQPTFATSSYGDVENEFMKSFTMIQRYQLDPNFLDCTPKKKDSWLHKEGKNKYEPSQIVFDPGGCFISFH